MKSGWRIVRWILVVTILCVVLVERSVLSKILLLLAAFAIVPILPLQRVFEKWHIKRWMISILAFLLVIIAALCSPSSKESTVVEEPLSRSIVSEETYEETQTPEPTPTPTSTNTPVPKDTPKPTDTPEPTAEPTPTPIPERDYVINTNTGKFHKPSCSSVGDIAAGNRMDYHGTYSDVINMGYEPCQRCDPY